MKLDLVKPALILVILGMASCSASNRLKRAEKLIAKAEAAGSRWTVDTVTVEVPVFVPETRVDSIFVVKAGDTVVLEKDRLKVKYVRLQGDTVYLEAECAADTIYQKVPVTIVKTIKPKQKIKWWWLPLIFIGGVVFWIGFLQVRQYQERRKS